MVNQAKVTRNSIIDSLLAQGKSTEEIVSEVSRQFQNAPKENVLRQIYSRRNHAKSKVTA